jgi:hypothetical protein
MMKFLKIFWVDYIYFNSYKIIFWCLLFMCSTHSPWCKYLTKKCSYWMAVRKKHSWNIHTFLNIFFQKQTNALCTKTSTRFHMICHKVDTMNLDVQYMLRNTTMQYETQKTSINQHASNHIHDLPKMFRRTRRNTAPTSLRSHASQLASEKHDVHLFPKKADKATKTAPPSSYHCCQLG